MPATATDRLNGLTTSVAVKAPCRAATTANITLSGEQTIDGVAVVSGDRVLVKSQTSAVNNGIYVAATSTWTRAPDFDGSLDAVGGTQVHVISGTANANTYWRVDGTDTSIVIGTDTITFEPAGLSDSAAITYLPGGVGAEATTVQEKLRRFVDVKDFGAVGDGVTDDTAGVQAAIDAVTPTGGFVHFSCSHGEKYLITDTISIRSIYPVSLLSEMQGAFTILDDLGSCIIVGAAMNYVFHYKTPAGRTRGELGGGSVRGLSIVDVTAPDGGSVGTFTITAALFLEDFGTSIVENCYFHWLKGSAIRTDFSVMSTIRGCRIRYCGDGANTALKLSATDSTYTTQSFVVDDCRLEVCYGDAYVDIGTLCGQIAISRCNFEAATIEYPSSSVTFIKPQAQGFSIENCYFNRNEVSAVNITINGRGKVTACHFSCGASASNTPTIVIAGARNIITGCQLEGGREQIEIEVTGSSNEIVGNMFYLVGGVYMTGRGNVFNSNTIQGISQTSGTNWLTLGGGHETCVGNKFDDNGSAPATNAINVNGADLVTGNHFDRWSAQVAIKREATATGAMIRDNRFDSVADSGEVQTLTGAGAINLLTETTHVVTTGANALTLADGAYDGQRKFIVMKTDGGDGTLTPTNLAGTPTTITFDDVGDSADLRFTNGSWHWLGGTATLA